MDYSSANTALWRAILQIGMIAAAVIAATVLRRKIAFVRKSLLPTAVAAGFLLLLLRELNLLRIDAETMEMLTYHALAIGFSPKRGIRSDMAIKPIASA